MERKPYNRTNAYHRSKSRIRTRTNKDPNAYSIYYVSPSITRRKPTKPVNPTIASDLSAEYARLGLHYYHSKEVFMKTMSHTAYTSAQKERFYSQYLKREALIKSGEYSDIRDQRYVNNYLGVLLQRLEDTSNPKLAVISNTLRKYARTKYSQIATLLSSGKLPDLTRYYIASDEEIFTFQGDESYESARAALRKAGMDVQTLSEFRKSGNEIDRSPLYRGADKKQRTRTAKATTIETDERDYGIFAAYFGKKDGK